MKKIFAVILASMLMISAVSCDGNKNADIGNTNIQQPSVDDKNGEDVPNTVLSNSGKLAALTSGEFFRIASYSMAPYRINIDEEKNMAEALSCFDGNVELTHYSFDTHEDALAYIDELAAKIPGEQLEAKNDGGIKSFKKQDGSNVYMAVCIDETILLGCGNNFTRITDWFYGLGYLAEK